MRFQSLRLAVACVAVVVAGWPLTRAAAQAPVQQPPGMARLYPVAPVPQIAPGVTLQGYGNNVTVLGKGYAQVPQQLLGSGGYSQGYGSAMFSLYGNNAAAAPGGAYNGGSGAYG